MRERGVESGSGRYTLVAVKGEVISKDQLESKDTYDARNVGSQRRQAIHVHAVRGGFPSTQNGLSTDMQTQ
jgi:hypothetical protein